MILACSTVSVAIYATVVLNQAHNLLNGTKVETHNSCSTIVDFISNNMQVVGVRSIEGASGTLAAPATHILCLRHTHSGDTLANNCAGPGTPRIQKPIYLTDWHLFRRNTLTITFVVLFTGVTVC